MRIFGLLLVVLGIALGWITSISSVVSWVLIIVGALIVIAGYFLKSTAS